jgi:DNA-binding IclR family transcriptional regulator
MAEALRVGLVESPDLVKSVQRALRVLEVVAERPDGLTAKAVARRAHIALSTTYHLLNTLVAEGYVVRLEGARGYGLGYQVSALSRSLRQRLGVTWAVEAAVAELHQRARAAACYTVFRDNELVVAHVVDSPDTPRVDPLDVGFAAAAHALACGKVMLASLASGERQEYLRQHGLAAFTERTQTDPSGLERELERVAGAGLATDLGEFRPDVACLAAPVHGPDGAVVGCVSVSLPLGGFEARRAQLEPVVRDAAARSSRALPVPVG